jgi:hypothetical protein
MPAAEPRSRERAASGSSASNARAAAKDFTPARVLFAATIMKSFLRPARVLLIASFLALSTSAAFAQSKTEALKDAQDQLEILKTKYADEHPQIVEQKLRITQLQRRVDEENPRRKELENVAAEVRARRAARQSSEQSSTANPIIRTEIRLLTPKADGGFDIIASPTLISQSGQDSSLSFGAYSVVLHSSIDEQNNITTSIELSINGSDGKPTEKIKLPLVKNRPGALSTINVAGAPSVEIRATLVDPKGISVDFPGGSLAQLLAAINKSNSEAFNLIASNEALALPIPQFSLRNVSPHNLALALAQILEGYTVDFPRGEERDGQPVFTIRPNQSQTSAAKKEQTKAEHFKSYPLDRLVLDQIPIEQVIEAINAAWTLDPANKPSDLKLKYHAATGTLLVSSRATAAMITTNEVIDSLREQAGFLYEKQKRPVPAATPKPAPQP